MVHVPRLEAAMKVPIRSGLLLTLALLAGCAGVQTRSDAPPAVLSPPASATGVVFCADGAGGFGGTSGALRDNLAAVGSSLYVWEFDWSHGRGRIVADQTDGAHITAEGRRLAGLVMEWKARRPGEPVYLVGHSAGCAVVLSAACCLGPGSVERTVLLSPAVSADYDLRPALVAVRKTVDVFCSDRDWAALGIATGIVGNTDRRWGPSAGRGGFRPVEGSPLYAKLRQHPWNPAVAWTGNRGGHYDSYKPVYLRAYVLPLLTERP